MLSYHRRISDVTVLASQIYRAWAYRYRQPAVGADLRSCPQTNAAASEMRPYRRSNLQLASNQQFPPPVPG